MYPALSIRPPWCAYILGSGPDRQCWHNVVWPRHEWPYYRGTIYVHIPLWWDIDDIASQAKQIELDFGGAFNPGLPEFLNTYRKIKDMRGHIVGMADLVDIVPGRDAWASPWVSTGGASPANHAALKLENPRLIPPVAARGKRRLWRGIDLDATFEKHNDDYQRPVRRTFAELSQKPDAGFSAATTS